MDALHRIAERRILAAVERGELDDLPAAGRPLKLADDRSVPAELYIVMRNAGFVPEEVEMRRRIRRLEDLLPFLHDEEEHERVRAELGRERLRRDLLMEWVRTRGAAAGYADRVDARLRRW